MSAAAPVGAGVVLAGGRARRMGGDDKGLLRVGDRYLVEYALARMTKQVATVFINANRNRAIYEQLDYPVVADEVGDFAGPLAGMHAGMRAAGSGWILTAPCDCPFFPADLGVSLWQAAMEEDSEVAVAVADGRDQPVFLLARCELADDIADFLRAGDDAVGGDKGISRGGGKGGGKIDRWYARRKLARVEFDDAAAFANINTPDDLESARRRLLKPTQI